MMKKTKTDKAKANHYVNNEEFLTAMISFRNAVISANTMNSERPRIPNYIGECFIKIGTHLSYKPNFINYTFRDDMISDGVENCLQYIDNFDPAKSRNPFAYFTQIIYYAFLRRIQKEKKQLYVKYKAMERSGILEEMAYQESAPGGRSYNIKETPMYSNMQDFVESYELSVKNQKEKNQKNKIKKAKGLEKFEKENHSKGDKII
jgi:hypothetical protein